MSSRRTVLKLKIAWFCNKCYRVILNFTDLLYTTRRLINNFTRLCILEFLVHTYLRSIWIIVVFYKYQNWLSSVHLYLRFSYILCLILLSLYCNNYCSKFNQISIYALFTCSVTIMTTIKRVSWLTKLQYHTIPINLSSQCQYSTIENKIWKIFLDYFEKFTEVRIFLLFRSIFIVYDRRILLNISLSLYSTIH